jgi:hypothetical protein
VRVSAEVDDFLEQAIARAAQRVVEAPGVDAKIAAFDELRRLHWMRAPEQVRAMETERGLS